MNLYLIKNKKYEHVSYNTIEEFESCFVNFADWKIINPGYNKTKTLFNKLCRRNDYLKYLMSKLKLEGYNFIINMNFDDIFLNYSLLLKNGKKAIYFFDVWENTFDKIKNMIDELSICTVFFSSKQTCQYFHSLKYKKKTNIYWIPEGMKIEDYKYEKYENKNIHIMQFGRKYDDLHQYIKKYSEKSGITYLYEKVKGEIIFKTKNEFIDALSKTKISVCVPSNITNPERSGNISTMTQRYLQSFISKCLVIGIMPEEMKELFDYEPIIKIDMENITKQLDNILNNFEKYISLIEKNYTSVIENHQWKNRILEITRILKY